MSLLGIACATLVAMTAAAFPWLAAIGGRPAVAIAAGVCGALAALARKRWVEIDETGGRTLYRVP